MSDTPLAALSQENQSSDQIKGLLAQLEAHKQMLGEKIGNVLDLTAKINILVNVNQEFQKKLQELTKLNCELASKLVNQGEPDAANQVSE